MATVGSLPIPVNLANQVSKTLLVDLSCNIASANRVRNVLKVRAESSNYTGTVSDQQFVLLQTAAGTTPSSNTIVAPTGNSSVIVSSDSPVHLLVTTSVGTYDFGQNTLFVLTSPIVSVQVINDLNYSNVNVACLII
jgi:hypothetical protein